MSTQPSDFKNEKDEDRASHRARSGRRVREMAVFSMLGALMFAVKVAMEFLPNIHPVGALTLTYTLVYRKKALIPLYIYVVLNGIFAGFSVWWLPYLYIWLPIFAAGMLLPSEMPRWLAAVVYPAVLGLHGLLFGILYAPAQALFFGLNFEETVAWVIAGGLFDVLHMVGNAALGLLVLPLAKLLFMLEKRY